MISVEDGLQELIKFDNTYLYPYIEKLLKVLKNEVNQSPMAYFKDKLSTY
jgi:hypothetical protein